MHAARNKSKKFYSRRYRSAGVNNSADCGLRCLPGAIIGENADNVTRDPGEMFSPVRDEDKLVGN